MVGAISGSAGSASYASLYRTGDAQGSRAQRGGTAQSTGTGTTLSAADQDLITRLKARDADVRAHEQAHRTAAGQLAGPASYTYQKGPDGANYAIGGEVSIDTSAIPNDPAATIAKESRVAAAALAPADPSAQDGKVAAAAMAAIAQAEAAKASGTGQSPGQGNGQGAGQGGAGGSDIGRTTATAANAQNGGGFNALAVRGLAAYQSAAGLGGLASPASRLAVYA